MPNHPGSPIQNAASLAASAANDVGARLKWNSTTSIALERHGNTRVVVAGEVSVVSGSLLLATSDNLIDSTGANAGAAAGASTTYCCYIASSSAAYAPSTFRLSSTSPTLVEGVYYLGSSGNALQWRFLGWVRTNASTQFEDSDTARFVVNYYNRRNARLFVCPAYANGNTDTTYSTAGAATWGLIHASASVGYIANGEDALQANAFVAADLIGALDVGIGDDSSTQPARAARMHALPGEVVSVATSLVVTPAAGYRTLKLLALDAGAAATIYADFLRAGAAADPAVTYLEAMVRA